MEAWVLGFLTGTFLNWYAVSILSVLGLMFSEHDHDIVATILFAGIVAILVHMFGITLTATHLVAYGVGYLICGFLWSFWRYRRHLATAVSEIMDSNNSGSTKSSRLERLHPKYMVDEIVLWIATWPFSFIANLFSDVIAGIRNLVNNAARRIYEWIYKATVKDFIESLSVETDKQ